MGPPLRKLKILKDEEDKVQKLLEQCKTRYVHIL